MSVCSYPPLDVNRLIIKYYIRLQHYQARMAPLVLLNGTALCVRIYNNFVQCEAKCMCRYIYTTEGF